MYESFFGLKEKPFSMIPDPEYLFLSTKHQRALTLLEYGMINQAGFSVICGDTGAGKTTLIRRLLSEMGDDTKVGLITNTHQSFGDLLSWVLMAFGIDPENKNKAQMHQMFISFLVEQYAQNKHCVLIVDEAQNMSADTLEELRMLSNINADKDQVLQVILAGQPALRETLRKPELMQFAQRIAVDYYLEALNEEETATYIKHRLKVAGAEEAIFTEDACSAVYKYSGGTPRLINLLCDTALVYGFAEQSKVIDKNLIDDVVREQHSSSVVPTYRKEKTEQSKEASEPVIEESIADAEDSKSKSQVESLNIKEPVKVSVEKQNNIKDELIKNISKSDIEPVDEIAAEETNESMPAIEQDEKSVSLKESEAHSDLGREVDEDQTESIEKAEESLKFEKVEETTGEPHEDESGYHSDMRDSRSRRSSDLYPVVQFEENKKSSISGVVIGFSAGMFIASILLVVFAFTYGVKETEIRASTAEEAVVEKYIPEETRVSEDERLMKLQEERDKALAITRALERERDAALAAAKAQEEMRAAEKRAAEIIAEQERKAAIEVRRAKERARKAELDAAKAKERERLAFEKAELERLKAEKIKLEKEMVKLESVKVEKGGEKVDPDTLKELSTKPVEAVVTVSAENAEKNLNKDSVNKDDSASKNKFIRNPCDSPSAKFLSTCKK